MTQPSNEQKPKSSEGGNSVRFLFTILGLAFAALIVATWHTINLAMAGHEPIIDKNYYEKGLDYEKEIAKSKQLQIEGYRFESIFSQTGANLTKAAQEVQVKLIQKDVPVNDAKLFLTRERTATSKYTERIELILEKDGIYKANLGFPFDGSWQVTLTADLKGRKFEKTYMVLVK